MRERSEEFKEEALSVFFGRSEVAANASFSLKGLLGVKFGGKLGPKDLSDSVGDVRGLEWTIIVDNFMPIGT